MPDSSLKVIAYIDGLNLYRGLCKAGWRRYLWLDVFALCEKVKQFNHELIKVKYFTADVINDNAKKLRQSAFLDAIDSNHQVEIIKGKHLSIPVDCHLCNRQYNVPKEKMTDVSIALNMVLDGQSDEYDVAFLISADSDLVPAVEYLTEILDKRVKIYFPPARWSDHLKQFCPTATRIGRSYYHNSQLAPRIQVAQGVWVEKPPGWV